MRNRRSSPPNVVHALDALHMLLTIRYLQKKLRLLLAAPIHDCIGVALNNLSFVKPVYRELFIKIYKGYY